MNQNQKFLTFMESLKNEENKLLVESVVSAFNVIMESETEALVEGKLSKAVATLAIPLLSIFSNAEAGMDEQVKIAKQVMKEYVQKHGMSNVPDAITAVNRQIQKQVDDSDQAEELTKEMVDYYEELQAMAGSKKTEDSEGTETGLEASSLKLTADEAIQSVVKASHGDLTEDDLEVSKITVPIKEGIFSDTEQDYFYAHRKGLTSQAKRNLETQLLRKVAMSVGSLPEPK